MKNQELASFEMQIILLCLLFAIKVSYWACTVLTLVTGASN